MGAENTMTNEEYALKIQQGNTDLYNELWENIKGLILVYANKFIITHNEKCIANGVTYEDLTQSGFIALTNAVKDYNPNKDYLLSSYLTFHLKTVYNELLGRRTSKRDVLEICTTLNIPAGDENDTELINTVADDTNPYEALEERIFQSELSDALHRSIDTLPDNLKAVINARYFDKLTYAQIEKRQGLTIGGIRHLECKALKKLKCGENGKCLKSFADEIMARAFRSSGLKAFKNMQASSVELTAEYLEYLLKNICSM